MYNKASFFARDSLSFVTHESACRIAAASFRGRRLGARQAVRMQATRAEALSGRLASESRFMAGLSRRRMVASRVFGGCIGRIGRAAIVMTEVFGKKGSIDESNN